MADEHGDAKDSARKPQAENHEANLTRYFQIVLEIMAETEQYKERN
jgi:hypothetical protein